MMSGKVTYRQQFAHCGKPRCRKCREGMGHGPYWYAYQTENGITTRTYVGKHLPPEAQAMIEAQHEQTRDTETSAFTVTLTGLTHATVRLFVLGQFRLERRRGQQWQPVIDPAWQQKHVRSLLGYLVSSPTRTVRRKNAMAALWPEQEAETASDNLDKCVETLRQLLEPVRSARGQSTRHGLPLLRSEGESLILAEQTRVWVDADAFEYLLSQAHAVNVESSATAAEEKQRLLEEAAALYTGEYLPEERHARGIITRRRGLQSSWIALLLELAELHIAHGAIPGAIDMLNHLLANDPLNEAAVQLLITALAQSQRRGEALRAYQRLADLLQREYDSVPSEKTRILYEAVLRGDDQAVLPGGSASSGTSTVSWEIESISATPLPLPPTQVSNDYLPTREGSARLPSVSSTEKGRLDTVSAEMKGRLDDTEEIFSGEGGTQAVAPGGEASMLQIGRTHQSPLIGRDRELGILRTLLLNAEQYAHMQAADRKKVTGIPLDTQHSAQCMILMGEVGIGKTRLAEEASREAQRRGWNVLWSRVYSQESGVPYRLWTELLRKAIDLGIWEEEEVSSHPAIYQPLTALLPELESVLPSKNLPGSALEQEQSRLWDAVYHLLCTASEDIPLVIVLDDLQWADGGSCQLLAHLARRVHNYPIVFVGTCREKEISSQAPNPLRRLIEEMLREHSVMTLDIEPLTSEQISALVSHIPNLPEWVVQHIQVQAAGNPFFAEELARTTPPTLPKTIAAALDHRISRLSDPCRLLLGNAAILGGSFEYPIICAMELEKPGGIATDEDSILDVLDEALQAGVLTEEGTGAHILYHFWHPLLGSHFYENLSLTRRTRLHRRAAEVLQEMYQGRQEEIAATITDHLIKGGADPVRIMRYAELAGDRAYLLSVYTEAERYYRVAVEYAERVTRASPGVGTNSTEQANLPIAIEPFHFIALMERLAECVMILGNFEEVRRLYERILELRNLHHDLVTDAQYEAQVQSLLWGEIERTWRYTGDKERARECSERSEQVLREAGVQGGPAWAKLRYQQSSLYWQQGRYEDAHAAAHEALLLFEQQQPEVVQVTPRTRIQRTLAGDPVELGRTHALLGALANGVGKRSQALAHMNTALQIFEQYDQKRGIAHVLCNLGYMHLKKAEYELALASLQRSLSLAEQLGDAPLASVVFSNLGELVAASDNSGDLEEAEQWYKKGLVLAKRFNDREYMSRWNAGLAAVLQEQGKHDEAAACIRLALSIGRTMHNSPCIGVALLALANLRVAQAQAFSKKLPKMHTRLLNHAKEDIQRVLALEGLEAETRTRSQLTLAQISLLMGAMKKAKALAEQVIDEAQQHELASVEEKARRLLEGQLIY
ncbi:MAG: DUF6788 family protein [Ktedonobacteraceae bacterium]